MNLPADQGDPITGYLHLVREAHDRPFHAAVCIRLVQQAFALLLAIVLIDTAFLLNRVERGLLLFGWLFWLLQSAWRLKRRLRRSEEAFLARSIEQRHPDLDNALIHAIQFRTAPAPASTTVERLKALERARAVRAIAALPIPLPDWKPTRTAFHRLIALTVPAGLLILFLPAQVQWELSRLSLLEAGEHGAPSHPPQESRSPHSGHPQPRLTPARPSGRQIKRREEAHASSRKGRPSRSDSHLARHRATVFDTVPASTGARLPTNPSIAEQIPARYRKLVKDYFQSVNSAR